MASATTSQNNLIYRYLIDSATQPPITITFSARLTARIVLIPHVRNAGARRPTSHTWYASDPTATAKKSGCKRWSQNRHPALSNETRPSPARTCGNTHQLG